jgi:hypothetical protein
MGGLRFDSDWTALLAGFVVAGAGIGLVNPVLASTSVGVVEPARSGMASGINNTFRQVGIATGVAALGAIFQGRVDSKLTELLAHTPAADFASRVAHIVGSGQVAQVAQVVPPPLRATVSHAARQAFISSLNELFVIAGICAFAGALLGLLLVRQSDVVATGAPAAAPAA